MEKVSKYIWRYRTSYHILQQLPYASNFSKTSLGFRGNASNTPAKLSRIKKVELPLHLLRLRPSWTRYWPVASHKMRRTS